MRTKKGVVSSAKMQGTVTVTVHRAVQHPLYQKRYRMSKKFLADSKGQDLGVGDEVVITECRPLSKRKCFRVTEVLKRAPRVSEMAEEGALEGVLQKTQKTPASAEAAAGRQETQKKQKSQSSIFSSPSHP